MARGTMYEIATDKKKLFIISERDISDYMDRFQIESVHDSEYSDTDRNVFLDWISNYYGAVITQDGGFKFTQDAKLKYFNKRYLLFKELAEKMSEEDFSNNNDKIIDISNIITDKYGDMITFFKDEKNTIICEHLDEFIRELDCDKTYYLGNTIIIK